MWRVWRIRKERKKREMVIEARGRKNRNRGVEKQTRKQSVRMLCDISLEQIQSKVCGRMNGLDG